MQFIWGLNNYQVLFRKEPAVTEVNLNINVDWNCVEYINLQLSGKAACLSGHLAVHLLVINA